MSVREMRANSICSLARADRVAGVCRHRRSFRVRQILKETSASIGLIREHQGQFVAGPEQLPRSAGHSDVSRLPHNEQLAFYINVHNATMIRAIIERYHPGYSTADNDFAVFKEPLYA